MAKEGRSENAATAAEAFAETVLSQVWPEFEGPLKAAIRKRLENSIVDGVRRGLQMAIEDIESGN